MITTITSGDGGNILFKEPTPSSERKTRILSLLMSEELSDISTRTYLDFQQEMNDLMTTGVSLPSGHTFNVNVQER